MTEKQSEEGRVYVHLQLPGYNPALREIRAGTQSRSLEGGTEAEAKKESYSLAHFLAFVQLTFMLQPRTTCQGMIPLQWTGPSYSINQESRLP